MWIDVKRKEQRACKPPESEPPKIVPAGTRAEVRRPGESEWQPHYLRRDFDVTGRPTDFHGFYHFESDGHRMRVHRSEVRKHTPTERKTPTPLVKMVPVHGNTHRIVYQLRRLGGKWYRTEGVWKVPETKLAAAKRLIAQNERKASGGVL